MRFASSQRRNRHLRLRRSTLLALGLVALVAPVVAADAIDTPSFVYCLNHNGAKVFAGREEANGTLSFGISVWSPTGQNISVFGIAIRKDNEWQHTEDMQAATAAQRCQLHIVLGSDGVLRVAADRNATCQNHGGVNAEIGTVQFPRTAYEGPVTTQLDDPEAFQRAGKCVGIEN